MEKENRFATSIRFDSIRFLAMVPNTLPQEASSRQLVIAHNIFFSSLHAVRLIIFLRIFVDAIFCLDLSLISLSIAVLLLDLSLVFVVVINRMLNFFRFLSKEVCKGCPDRSDDSHLVKFFKLIGVTRFQESFQNIRGN